MLRYSLLGLALLCVATSASAAPKVFEQVPGSEYREQIDTPVSVSGLALVGLALAGPIDLDAKVLYVYLTQPFDGRLRLEMTTADGRFRAQALYEGQSKGLEWVALSIEPHNDDKQSRAELKRNPTELAVAVRPVTTGGTAIDTLLQVSWGKLPDAQADRTLRLYVNSRRADMFVRAPGMDKEKGCTQLHIPNAVRFDTVCEIPWRPPAASKLSAPKPQLQLLRRDGFDESQQRVLVQ
jgi:hypothetical protein